MALYVVNLRRRGRRPATIARKLAVIAVYHPIALFLNIPAGLCDRTLLLVGWAAALRRSEARGIETSDQSFEPQGVVLTIRRSKADREGAPARRWQFRPVRIRQLVAIPRLEHGGLCAAAALEAWLPGAAPTEIDAMGVHSLRRGFVTSADMAGGDDRADHGRDGDVGIRSRCAATRAASCTIPS